eukprot:SAG31_NODE_2866_length_4979_cov_3.027869_5_plen_82_part_00
MQIHALHSPTQLTDLTVFNVSLNGLEDVPSEFTAFTKLESLNLNDNRLKECPPVVRSPSRAPAEGSRRFLVEVYLVRTIYF